MLAARSRLQPGRTTTLPVAMLLASSGGLLDAVVYLGHGGVFVTAMTGNAVLMAIAAASGNLAQVARQLDVIGGFLAGLTAAELSRTRPLHLIYRFAVALEIAMIALAGLLAGHMPLLLLLALLAFVSAFQIALFRRVGPFTYNSTFVTGNLRDVVESLVDRFFTGKPAQRQRSAQRAFDLALICAAFLIGAVAGASLQPRFPGHALWFAELPLLPVLLFALLHRPQDQPAAAENSELPDHT